MKILTELSLSFEQDHLGSSHGQDDWKIVAYNEDEIAVGYISYAEYDDIPSVNIIEVHSDWKRKATINQGNKLWIS